MAVHDGFSNFLHIFNTRMVAGLRTYNTCGLRLCSALYSSCMSACAQWKSESPVVLLERTPSVKCTADPPGEGKGILQYHHPGSDVVFGPSGLVFIVSGAPGDYFFGFGSPETGCGPSGPPPVLIRIRSQDTGPAAQGSDSRYKMEKRAQVDSTEVLTPRFQPRLLALST